MTLVECRKLVTGCPNHKRLICSDGSDGLSCSGGLGVYFCTYQCDLQGDWTILAIGF